MPTLERLRADHAEALFAFERDNRGYFARTVPDRGDAYFAHFTDRLGALLAEQEEGVCHFHVVLGDDGEVAARVNLVDVDPADGSAELGYRVAERYAGRGLATAAVREVCGAAASYGLRALTAVTHEDHLASRRVLERTGFTATGRFLLDGRPAVRHRRSLEGLMP
ncbi:GNAT family N-acetyltransferase [Streptomyces abyssomicinicus]|uniref:GNAT family N-acetyltransferase n=1 Tax=Streptomyces abyssomicinicus TaxID=574929 RepID=UPI0012502D7C|nr:GNAT family N-acetyltransferase [Streptomyces abyssomicinicus]